MKKHHPFFRQIEFDIMIWFGLYLKNRQKSAKIDSVFCKRYLAKFFNVWLILNPILYAILEPILDQILDLLDTASS